MIFPMTQNSLQNVIKSVEQVGEAAALPPVEDWNPPYCGDIGIRIGRDGTWYVNDSPIGRQRLVRLFSTVLRRDEDGNHYLVTPVEKILVTVEDAPFLATQMDVSGAGETQELTFTTNVGDKCPAGPEAPLHFEFDENRQPGPYVHVRGRLRAKIARPVFYRLVDLAVTREEALGVWSRGAFFALSDLEDLAGLENLDNADE